MWRWILGVTHDPVRNFHPWNLHHLHIMAVAISSLCLANQRSEFMMGRGGDIFVSKYVRCYSWLYNKRGLRPWLVGHLCCRTTANIKITNVWVILTSQQKYMFQWIYQEFMMWSVVHSTTTFSEMFASKIKSKCIYLRLSRGTAFCSNPNRNRSIAI